MIVIEDDHNVTILFVPGYVFSASLPPMLASAATMALELIDNDVTMTARLRDISEALHTALSDVDG